MSGEMCHLLLHTLVADTTQLYRFNKDQSGKRSSTNLQNVRHCSIITHSKWASFPSVSLCLFLLWSSWVRSTAVMLWADTQLFKATCKIQTFRSTDGATKRCVFPKLVTELKFILFKAKPTPVDHVVNSVALPATMFKHLKVNIKQTSI